MAANVCVAQSHPHFSMQRLWPVFVIAGIASGNTVERYFCGDCGSPIDSAPGSQPDTLFLKPRPLDDSSSLKPTFHVSCGTK